MTSIKIAFDFILADIVWRRLVIPRIFLKLWKVSLSDPLSVKF